METIEAVPEADKPATILVCPDPYGRLTVTRDMELIRLILRRVQAKNDLKPEVITIDGYADPLVRRHMEMLIDAGMLDGAVSRPLSDPTPIIMVRDLTWAGHDLAGALLNETVWVRIKGAVAPTELATMPLAIIKNVGVAVAEKWLLGKLGL